MSYYSFFIQVARCRGGMRKTVANPDSWSCKKGEGRKKKKSFGAFAGASFFPLSDSVSASGGRSTRISSLSLSQSCFFFVFSSILGGGRNRLHQLALLLLPPPHFPDIIRREEEGGRADGRPRPFACLPPQARLSFLPLLTSASKWPEKEEEERRRRGNTVEGGRGRPPFPQCVFPPPPSSKRGGPPKFNSGVISLKCRRRKEGGH